MKEKNKLRILLTTTSLQLIDDITNKYKTIMKLKKTT